MAQAISSSFPFVTITLNNLPPPCLDGWLRFTEGGERHHEPSVRRDSRAGDSAAERGVQRAQHYRGESGALAGHQGCLRPRQAREAKERGGVGDTAKKEELRIYICTKYRGELGRSGAGAGYVVFQCLRWCWVWRISYGCSRCGQLFCFACMCLRMVACFSDFFGAQQDRSIGTQYQRLSTTAVCATCNLLTRLVVW